MKFGVKQTRNQKPEIRMKSQTQNQKKWAASSFFGFRVLGIHSGFGFRASGLSCPFPPSWEIAMVYNCTSAGIGYNSGRYGFPEDDRWEDCQRVGYFGGAGGGDFVVAGGPGDAGGDSFDQWEIAG